MNRRSLFRLVLGAVTAGLARPWWMRDVEPHTLGSYGRLPKVLNLPTNQPIRHVEEVGGALYVVTETEIWVVYPDGSIHQRAAWDSALAEFKTSHQWGVSEDLADRRAAGRPMLSINPLADAIKEVTRA